MPSNNNTNSNGLFHHISRFIGRHSHDDEDDDDVTVCLDRGNDTEIIHVRRIPVEVVDDSEDNNANSMHLLHHSPQPPPFLEPPPTRFWNTTRAHYQQQEQHCAETTESPRPRRWSATPAIFKRSKLE